MLTLIWIIEDAPIFFLCNFRLLESSAIVQVQIIQVTLIFTFFVQIFEFSAHFNIDMRYKF